LTVTVALAVDVPGVAVIQYPLGEETITFIVTAVPPVPVDPPVAAPPVPVEPPVPAFPAIPPVPVEPPVLLPPVPVVTLSTQLLLAQCWVVVQACPQEPQFAALLVVSKQAVPHMVWLPEQVEPQLLLLQTSPVAQVIEQLPQWVASDATQEPLQKICPDAHLHTLPWQVCPPGQALPQTPQLLTSEVTSTQVEPQAICPELQVTPVPPVPLPPVPVELLPPVPRMVPGCALVQAAERIAKPSPRNTMRAVVITTLYSRADRSWPFPCGEL
jgi:hypothetical protein